MTPEEFRATIEGQSPPRSFSEPLEALWWDFKGDWDRAHGVAQEISSVLGSAIHAYLHRKEGVIWNADHWYRRAGRIRPDIPLEDERERLLNESLAETT